MAKITRWSNVFEVQREQARLSGVDYWNDKHFWNEFIVSGARLSRRAYWLTYHREYARRSSQNKTYQLMHQSWRGDALLYCSRNGLSRQMTGGQASG